MSNQSSMIGTGEGGFATSHPGSAEATPGSASERAQTLRASLSVRRDAESLFAEASQLRRAAAAEADAMVAEAELLAEQLIAESSQTAERTTAEATERAEALVQRARSEAAELTLNARAQAAELTLRARKEVEEFERQVEQERARLRAEVMKESRAEIEAIRHRSDMVLNDIEAGVRGMGPKLEGAMNVLVEVMRSLEQERAEVVSLTEEAHQSLSSMRSAPEEPVAHTETTSPTEPAAQPEPDASVFERPAEPFASSAPTPFAASASVASFTEPAAESAAEAPVESQVDIPSESVFTEWGESSYGSEVPAPDEAAHEESDELVEAEEHVDALAETRAQVDLLVDPVDALEEPTEQPTENLDEEDELASGRHSTTHESVDTVTPQSAEGDELVARPLGWLFRASQV